MKKERKTAKLFAPPDYKKASIHALKGIVNGCGSGKAKFDFVPDTIYGLSIQRACNIHDWMYHFGENFEDKVIADRVFLNNMLRLIEAGKEWKWLKWLKKLRKRRAWIYFQAVKKFGSVAFWNGK